jgi:sirohydrochlorin ferrochelatase
VVVQPHLLFDGDLADRIRGDVEAVAGRHRATQWLVTGHLGPADLVAQAVVDIATR